MTVKEFSSRSIQFQICFWDAVIWMISSLHSIRTRYFIMLRNDRSPKKNMKILVSSLAWLAFGLYLGIILGFLNI